MDERVKGEYKLFFHQTAMTILGWQTFHRLIPDRWFLTQGKLIVDK
jgi:hypothetical protein